MSEQVILGTPVTIEDVVDVARGRRSVALSEDAAFRTRLGASRRHFDARIESGNRVYGVTTGFGESCLNEVADEGVHNLPLNLLRFHGVGTGRILDDVEAGAVVMARLASLCSGWSAVRPLVVERLCELLGQSVLPRIPAEGSVGASGDLTPLSYIAALLVGEREASVEGQVMSAAQAHERVGVEPLELAPKESLSIMNGTSVMAGLACLGFERALALARWSAAITAMAQRAMQGNPSHFDDRLFAAKPHPGQRLYATWVRDDMDADPADAPARIQDRYSIRCSPHVVGVLLDFAPTARRFIEIEVNGANDNPLIDPETGAVLHGGNFYGGHIAFVCDALKNAVANVADLMDRQMVLLCDPGQSNALPENLVGVSGAGSSAHHGFKAMQIATSALAAEALKLTMPASVFSRSTEAHNQDKVSMGTIASRDLLRVLELTETVASMLTLAVCQAVELRGLGSCGPRAAAIHAAVRRVVPPLGEDRRQDLDIAAVLEIARAHGIPFGEVGEPSEHGGS